VLGPVLKDVKEGGARFPWRSQLMRVIAIAEDATAVAEGAVDCQGHANRQSLHAARKGSLILSLDDEVQVVRLYREVHHAKPGLLARADRSFDAFEQQPIPPEARQAFARSHRHMDRMPGEMWLAPSMGHAHSKPARLAPGAFAATTVAGGSFSGSCCCRGFRFTLNRAEV